MLGEIKMLTHRKFSYVLSYTHFVVIKPQSDLSAGLANVSGLGTSCNNKVNEPYSVSHT